MGTRRSRRLVANPPWRRLGGERRAAITGALALLVVLAGACGGTGRPGRSAAPLPVTTAPTSTAPTSTTPATTAPATTAPAPSTRTTTPATTVPLIGLGDSGPAVTALQQRLTALDYWLGPVNGQFGETTQQAVYAIQKAAGIGADGVVGPQTEAALAAGVVPQPRRTTGTLIEVDLADDLLLFVDDGHLQDVLNTSTGGGYTYVVDGQAAVADTPEGHFTIFRQVDGMVTDVLGQLWMPKFFDAGYAIHGDSYVPPYPVSHGCVRVSNEAIEWIWSADMAPIGTAVWIY